jgi:DNA-binding SARP family transcriptional activator
VDLLTGVFVSLGLAGAIAAAVMSIRIWRRRRYRIGSGDRADLQRPIAPVVRALCAAHDDGDLRPVEDAELVDLAAPGESKLGGEPARVPTKIGVRERRELALDLASTRGLGLAGAGATAAARALLLHLLAEQQPGNGVGVIVPVDDLRLVFGGVAVEDLPTSVHVVATLDAALDEMEAALLTRTRHAIEETGARPAVPSLVLLACPASHADRRLQAVLDNGSTLGLAGVLLGQWRPGATLLVRQDGTVSATSPGIDEILTGTRLFNVPAADATSLLEVLRAGEGATDPTSEPVSEQRSTEVEATSSLEQEEHHADDNQPAASEEPPLDTKRPRLFLRVLGRVQLVVRDEAGDRELSGAFTPRQREVLVFLALHPQGARREVLNEAVWPDSRPPRPYNSFHNTLSTLRRALADAADGQTGNLVLNEDGRYRLSDELLDVDFWQLQRVLQMQRPPDEHGSAGLRGAVELYRGDLAEDLLAQWIEPFRESVRRDVLDALGALIRADGDIAPETALVLLERARKLDQYNEGVYRDIIRMQARLGQYAAIPRTVTLLTTTLTEIDQQVSAETLNLADFLQRRGSTRWKDAADSAAAS